MTQAVDVATYDAPENPEVASAEAPGHGRFHDPGAHAPGVTTNPYLLRLIDQLDRNQRDQATAINRLVDTIQADNAAMRNTVTAAVGASTDRFEAHSVRLDRTVRWVVGGALVVVVACVVALGAVVDARIAVEAGNVKVGASEDVSDKGTPARFASPESPR